jgi:ribosomal protein S18 acetylase RimI-like enzyme
MKNRQVQIRPLQGVDINQIIVLDKSIGGEDRADFFRKRLQAMERSPKTYISMVVADKKRVYGFLLANVLTGEFGGNNSVAQIDALGVQPGEQGSGFGMQLMNALKDEAVNRRCTGLRTQASWQQQELLAYFASADFTLAPRNILKRTTITMREPDELDDQDSDAWQLPPVRSLQVSDLNDILRIDRHISGKSREDYIKQKVTEAISDSGIRISLVGVQDGMVAGFIMARLDYGSFGRTSSTAVIDTIGVGPEYQGSGIGSALMMQLLDNLASLQVEDMRTEVEWNNFQLNRFLAACGFTPAQALSLNCAL